MYVEVAAPHPPGRTVIDSDEPCKLKTFRFKIATIMIYAWLTLFPGSHVERREKSMHKQCVPDKEKCVPDSLFSIHTREPGNDTNTWYKDSQHISRMLS